MAAGGAPNARLTARQLRRTALGGVNILAAGLESPMSSGITPALSGGAEYEAWHRVGSMNDRELFSNEKGLLNVRRGNSERKGAATRTIQQGDFIGVRGGSTRLDVFRSN